MPAQTTCSTGVRDQSHIGKSGRRCAHPGCLLADKLTTKTSFQLQCALILGPNCLKHHTMELYCWAERFSFSPHHGISLFSHSQKKCSHWGHADTRSFPCPRQGSGLVRGSRTQLNMQVSHSLLARGCS